MCFASQALMDAFLVPLRNPPFSSSSAAFILIYYGHGFFGTKICLLYKKRAKYKKKLTKNNNKSARNRVRVSAIPSPKTRHQKAGTVPKQTHPHIPKQPHPLCPILIPYHPHGIRIKGAQQKASLRQILRSDKKMIKR